MRTTLTARAIATNDHFGRPRYAGAAGGSQKGRRVRFLIVQLPPFQDLVDAYWRDVARLSYALAGRDDGDDCAQRAWEQALAAYPRLRHDRNLKSWLLTITHRVAIDGHRARARRPVPVAAMPDYASTDAERDPDPELWAAVRTLPERQRVAIALRYVLDLDHAEIARQLHTTQTMSRRLISDGLALLRKELGHD
jgi:RNA polymerase sigma factor (sigma-70 family)